MCYAGLQKVLVAGEKHIGVGMDGRPQDGAVAQVPYLRFRLCLVEDGFNVPLVHNSKRISLQPQFFWERIFPHSIPHFINIF